MLLYRFKQRFLVGYKVLDYVTVTSIVGSNNFIFVNEQQNRRLPEDTGRPVFASLEKHTCRLERQSMRTYSYQQKSKFYVVGSEHASDKYKLASKYRLYV